MYVNFLIDLLKKVYYNIYMNTDMEYTLIRADRKTVGIRIGGGGEIIVRAPRHASRAQIDGIVKKNMGRIEKMRRLALETEDAYTVSSRELCALKRLAAETLLPILDKYSNLTGLVPGRVRIGSAKKRFGSCSSSGSITLSCFLMLYPMAAAEYVAVHELCHLVYMNHSKEFYALVEKHMPDFRAREKLLGREYMKKPSEVPGLEKKELGSHVIR